MIFGFSGSRGGMTEVQQDRLRALITQFRVDELHHGDCVGADAQAHAIAVEMGLRIVIHPPSDPRLRAWCELSLEGGEIMKPLPYAERNLEITRAGTLVAVPGAGTPRGRGGTWMTYKLAEKNKTPRLLISPAGRAY